MSYTTMLALVFAIFATPAVAIWLGHTVTMRQEVFREKKYGQHKI